MTKNGKHGKSSLKTDFRMTFFFLIAKSVDTNMLNASHSPLTKH